MPPNFNFREENVAELAPCCRHLPASCPRRIAMICPCVNWPILISFILSRAEFYIRMTEARRPRQPLQKLVLARRVCGPVPA